MNGYDRYLDFQYRRSGSFFTFLFQAIAQADGNNTTCLELGFPEEVDAYRIWSRDGGAQGLLPHISLSHGCRAKFIEEHSLYDGPINHLLALDKKSTENVWRNMADAVTAESVAAAAIDVYKHVRGAGVLAQDPIPYVPLVFLVEEEGIQAWQELGSDSILVEIDSIHNDEAILEVIRKVYWAERAERELRESLVTK